MPLLLKKKFWDVKANEIDEKLSFAAMVFVHWPHNNTEKYKTRKAKYKLVSDHLDWIYETSKKMNGWIDNLGGFQKSVHSSDFMSFFVRLVAEAFGEEVVMEAVEERLIYQCKMVDPHFNYIKNLNNNDGDDSDSEAESIAELVEQY